MEVCANWVPESSKALKDIVKECKTLPTGGLDSLLDEECCLSLTKPPEIIETNECSLRVSTRLSHQVEPGQNPSHVPTLFYQMGSKTKRKVFNGILIVSEARLIEVFKGEYGEYYKTVQGDLLAEVEESKLYRCVISFDKYEENVILRFKHMCDSSSLWIYAIYVSTKIIVDTEGLDSSTRFSGKHLSSVLEEHNVVVSDEANKFRNILESFNNEKSSRVRADGKDPMQMMMMMGAFMGMSPGSKKDFGNDLTQTKSIQNNSLKSRFLDYGKEGQSHPIQNKHSLESLFSTVPPDDSNSCSERRYSISSQTESCSGESTLSDTSLDGDETIPKSPIKMSTTDDKLNAISKVNLEDNMGNFIGKMQSFLNEDGNEANKDKLDFLMGFPQKKLSCLSKEQNHETKDSKITETKVKVGKPEEPRLMKTKLYSERNIENKFSIMENIETIIDDKITAMEKRILRKIDDKFSEKKKEDNERFDKLESMLMQLMENKMHSIS